MLATRTRRAARSLRSFVAPHWPKLAAGLAVGIAAPISTLTIPVMLRQLFDAMPANATERLVVLYAVGLSLVAVAGALARAYMRNSFWGAVRQVERSVRREGVRGLMAASPESSQSMNTGDVLARLTGDIDAVTMVVGPTAEAMLSSAITFIVGSWLLMRMDWRLASIMVAMLCPIVALVVVFSRKNQTRYADLQQRGAEITTVVQRCLAAIRLIKAYGMEAAQIQSLDASAQQYVTCYTQSIARQVIFNQSINFVAGLAFLPILWLGARHVDAGRLTVGGLIMFAVSLPIVTAPTTLMGWLLLGVQRGAAAWRRTSALLPPDSTTTQSRLGSADVLRGAVTLTSASDVLAGGKIVVRITPGAKVALVGQTASGKTHVLRLLARGADAPRGEMFYDDRDVLDVPLETIRRQVAVVQEEASFFSGTVLQNLLFMRTPPAIVPHDVLQAAHTACIDEDIHGFEKGYHTDIGERGTRLSGGQRQRLALARALLRRPSILLLDDALSAVDASTEQKILDRLRASWPALTCIVACSRITTAAAFESIILMDEGRILEQGSLDDHMKRNGRLAALIRRHSIASRIGIGDADI